MKRIHREILNQLLAQENLTLESFVEKPNKNAEQIIKAIQEINVFLANGTIRLEKNQFILNEAAYDECLELLYDTDDSYIVFLEVQIRRKLILLLILVSNKKYTLQEFADLLYVSKNTICSDIKKISSSLPEFLSLNYSRKEGYQVEGNEYIILNLITEVVGYLSKFREWRSKMLDILQIERTKIDQSQELVKNIEKVFDIKLTDENFSSAPFIIHILIMRINISNSKDRFPKYDWGIRKEIEFEKIISVFPIEYNLSSNDIEYLALWFMSLNLVDMKINSKQLNDIETGVSNFINQIEKRISVNFLNKSALRVEILQHIFPAFYRQILSIKLENPLTKRFKEEHPLIFTAVSDSIYTIEKYLVQNFSDDELVYVAMIILGRLYEDNAENEKAFKAIVLCTNGTSISKFLLETLRRMFPNINFVGAYSFREFEDIEKNVDLIFSTKPFTSKIPIVVVSPFLDNRQRQKIIKEVQELILDNQDVYTKKLIESILPFIDAENISDVESKIYYTLNQIMSLSKTKNNNEKINIQHFNISIIKTEANWEDAIEVVFNPMYERGSVTKEYINKVSDIFYKDFEYMVIGENIYLPHAHPKFGVNNVDYQIVLFLNPKDFPVNENIIIFVALAPGENNEHIPLILELNERFSNKNILEGLKESQTIEDVLDFLEWER